MKMMAGSSLADLILLDECLEEQRLAAARQEVFGEEEPSEELFNIWLRAKTGIKLCDGDREIIADAIQTLTARGGFEVFYEKNGEQVPIVISVSYRDTWKECRLVVAERGHNTRVFSTALKLPELTSKMVSSPAAIPTAAVA